MDLIIADSDCFYTAALAERLKRWDKAGHIEQCGQAEDLHHLIAARKGKKNPACFLFNPAEFNALVHLPASPVWPAAWMAIPILPGRSSQAEPAACQPEGSTPAYHRFDPVSRLLELLTVACAAGPASETDVAAEEPASDPGTGMRHGRPGADARLWLALSLTGADGQARSRQRLRELVGQGRQVIYLPLMPTYLMDQVPERTQGPTLSDLLLRLLGDAMKEEDLGCFWQTSPAGYLCFRPPERSDDLLACDPDILRRLALLLKQKTAADPTGQMLVFIHCLGLQLSSVAAIGVVCDICEIDLPQGQTFMAKSARAEAGRLLAQLPASCQVIRHVHAGREAKTAN